MQKQFEPLYLLSLAFLFFLLLNKPLLLTPRKEKQTFNISDICETENPARPSRNTVDMLNGVQWRKWICSDFCECHWPPKNENTKINDCIVSVTPPKRSSGALNRMRKWAALILSPAASDTWSVTSNLGSGSPGWCNTFSQYRDPEGISQHSSCQLKHRDTCFTDGSTEHFGASQRDRCWSVLAAEVEGREGQGKRMHSANAKNHTRNSFYISQPNKSPHPFQFCKKKDPQLWFTQKGRKDAASHTYHFASKFS